MCAPLARVVLFVGIAILCARASAASDGSVVSVEQNRTHALPMLNIICNHTFSWPYSCPHNHSGSLQYAYPKSALFLSNVSRSSQAPDLLYDGGCKDTVDVFVAITHPFGFGLITDLGDTPLATLRAAQFQSGNASWGVSAAVHVNHTYGLLLARVQPAINGLVYFRVTDYALHGECSIQYAVKWYSVDERTRSGADWNAPSAPAKSAALCPHWTATQ